MNGKLAAFLTMMVFLTATIAVFTAEESNAAPESTVTGIVGQQGNSGMVPAEEAILEFTYTIPGSTLESTTETITKNDGSFSVTLPFTDTDIKIVLNCKVAGHTIFSVPECITYSETKDEFSFTLGDLKLDAEKYIISSSLASSIVISDARVHVEITVTGSSGPINGADVALYSNQKKITNGTSNNEGICKFSSPILIGTYELRVVCEGCEDYSEQISITKASTQFSATIEEKGVPTVLGFTIYHVLMVFGVIIGLSLVTVAYVLCSRTWKGLE